MFYTWYGVFWAYLSELKTALKVVICTEWSFKRSTDSPQRRHCFAGYGRGGRQGGESSEPVQLHRPAHLIGQCFVRLDCNYTTEPNYFHYFQASPPPRPSLSPNYLFRNCHLLKPGVRSRPDPHHVCALFRWIQVSSDKIEEQI